MTSLSIFPGVEILAIHDDVAPVELLAGNIVVFESLISETEALLVFAPQDASKKPRENIMNMIFFIQGKDKKIRI